MGLEGLLDMVQELDAARVVEVFHLQSFSQRATPSSLRVAVRAFSSMT
jgi:hypothetical protein